MTRRDIIAAAAGALAASTLAGGVAWAAIPDSGGVISGCYGKFGGIVRVIDTAKNEKCLPSLEVPISWSQKGPKGDPGTNGASPTVAQLSPGDTNCATGGAAIKDAAGSTAYVCNGQNGQDGQSFAGSFTSPNGNYSITVDDTGITLRNAGGPSIVISGADITTRSTGTIHVLGDGIVTIRGAQVNIN